MITTLFYPLRWVIFLLRWIAYALWGLLNFAAKPGSRLVCPAAAAAAVFLCRLPLDAAASRYVLDVDWRQLPEPVTAEALAASGIALAICVYVVLAPRLSAEGTAASGLLRFFLRLTVLLTVAGSIGWLAGYRLPGDFMATYAPWMGWQPTLADAVLLFALVAAAFVYAVASRLLALVLGAFPPVVRPLRPLRRLRASKRAIRPVVVRVAVPKLAKRKRPTKRRGELLRVEHRPVSELPAE
jgi:hypothetical protein